MSMTAESPLKGEYKQLINTNNSEALSVSKSQYSKYKGVSTSKYLMNDEDDDRLSNLSEIFDPKDEKRFINVYNQQGHYSSTQSVAAVFTRVSPILNQLNLLFIVCKPQMFKKVY